MLAPHRGHYHGYHANRLPAGPCGQSARWADLLSYDARRLQVA